MESNKQEKEWQSLVDKITDDISNEEAYAIGREIIAQAEKIGREKGIRQAIQALHDWRYGKGEDNLDQKLESLLASWI